MMSNVKRVLATRDFIYNEYELVIMLPTEEEEEEESADHPDPGHDAEPGVRRSVRTVVWHSDYDMHVLTLFLRSSVSRDSQSGLINVVANNARSA